MGSTKENRPNRSAVGYRKVYRLRTTVQGRKSIAVTFPFEVVEREARSRGLTIEEFLDSFQAIAEYDNFPGVRYTFEEIEAEVGGANQ